MLAMVFVFALIAGGIGWLTRQRSPQPVPVNAGRGYPSTPRPAESGWTGSLPGRPRDDLADGEAETSYWVDRLGSGITALDGRDATGNEPARQALSDAAERHTAARKQLREANTPKQYELATRTAIEGLYYIRAARTALGLDPGPEVELDQVPQLSSARRVTVDDQDLVASPSPGAETPYYYPGGRVGNRMIPGGWYSSPWWKKALIAGGVGLGSMVLLDALFDTGPGDGGLFDIGGHHGLGGHGFGGGMDGPGGMLDGGLFGGDMDGFGF